jgi:hypothetical protein
VSSTLHAFELRAALAVKLAVENEWEGWCRKRDSVPPARKPERNQRSSSLAAWLVDEVTTFRDTSPHPAE